MNGLSKNTKDIRGIKFFHRGEQMFLQLEKGGWRGWIFYYHAGNNGWVSLKEATTTDLLNILDMQPTHTYITV